MAGLTRLRGIGSAASMPPSSALSSRCGRAMCGCSESAQSEAHRAGPRRGHVGARSCNVHVRRTRLLSPLIDGGLIQLHVRAPAGTRIETTERIFQAVEDKIRQVIPEDQRSLIVDNIGLPARAYNLAFSDGSTIGPNDGVIQVQLKEGHPPTADYIRKLREVLPAAFPDTTFYFQAADIVTQILNFGLPAQIDVRTVGYDRAKNLQVAQELRQRIAAIPGIADAHLQQEVNGPALMPTSTVRARPGSASPRTASPRTSMSA